MTGNLVASLWFLSITAMTITILIIHSYLANKYSERARLWLMSVFRRFYKQDRYYTRSYHHSRIKNTNGISKIQETPNHPNIRCVIVCFLKHIIGNIKKGGNISSEYYNRDGKYAINNAPVHMRNYSNNEK